MLLWTSYFSIGQVLMVDANQKSEEEKAAENMESLKQFRPWWIEEKIIDNVAYLHERFYELVLVKNRAYMPPKQPGYSITMKTASWVGLSNRFAYSMSKGAILAMTYSAAKD